MRRVAVTLALVLALVAATAAAQFNPPRKPPDVPFVATDDHIVDHMLEIANVGKDDVLYDLGSGDGRILITAARRFGTRGVGIEIDPSLVRVSRLNAKKAGVSDRVTFILGDIFVEDISPATVVTMYLLPEVNMRLRPRLLTELRPGTRIVSHNYDLGDWLPLRHQTLYVNDIPHHVFFWVVPPRPPAGR